MIYLLSREEEEEKNKPDFCFALNLNQICSIFLIYNKTVK
jgi:hypothetical protein